MMNTAPMFSSATDDWATPQGLFDRLNAAFGFELDVCATPDNAKCPRFYTREDDGLAQTWTGRCWMNPPYGREIGQWVRKALESSRGGGTCRVSRPGEDGHGVVERVRGACRYPFHPWASEIRKCNGIRTVPVGHPHFLAQAVRAKA